MQLIFQALEIPDWYVWHWNTWWHDRRTSSMPPNGIHRWSFSLPIRLRLYIFSQNEFSWLCTQIPLSHMWFRYQLFFSSQFLLVCVYLCFERSCDVFGVLHMNKNAKHDKISIHRLSAQASQGCSRPLCCSE